VRRVGANNKTAGSRKDRSGAPAVRGHQRRKTAARTASLRYKGDDGMKRWVGLVIPDSLINIGRVLATRASR
jgi:hypothetical protein